MRAVAELLRDRSGHNLSEIEVETKLELYDMLQWQLRVFLNIESCKREKGCVNGCDSRSKCLVRSTCKGC